ncbi:hypothetical protein [Arenibacter sp. S6351L]|uniref:hypothetical protein n=1 Tax=Arenibacter sp. S6351L TaxID=2926407 RepID=UPI001FF5B629|nr:hypothetical protein [Arenibacter sp. S6351L]MCK0134918.1 hypothetical protein [Arenibacter sp. S6351L]
MTPQEIGLIDNRNEKLWSDLNNTHSISIELNDYPNYASDSENSNSRIIVPKYDIDINAFTHELLHILIRQKELYLGSSFRHLIIGSELLSQLLSDQLLEHFSNCMDHIKMLPIFLELGFDKKKFIKDYDVNKCTKSEIQQLRQNFKIRGKYYGEAVDFYIAKYIAIKADPKQHINYTKSLNELKNLDSNLFSILEKAVEDWKTMPFEKENIWDDDYNSISFELYQSLSNWTEGKTFL